ncbi:MAG: hypothetical protein INF43_00005, partial [Alphaproteobacteria bacterium]|nr:hypothetical protein [Alphaproteobacteria bacterium]
QATSKETGWQGAGVTLSRPLVERLTTQGQVEVVSRGAWSVASVACQRPQQRQVQVPCDGSTVEVCTESPPVSPTIIVTTTTVMVNGTPQQVTRTIEIPGVQPPPVCELKPAGNINQGCITDYRPGSITVDLSPAGYVWDGTQMVLKRNWSYTSSKSVYSTNCGGELQTRFNSGLVNVTVGLNNDLLTTNVISSDSPNLLQEYCSQTNMNQGWTTHDYGGGDGGDGGDSAGDCGCDAGNGGGGNDGCGDSM